MYSIVDRVIETAGDACGCEIGHEIGEQSGIQSLGDFGRRVASMPTLGDAIRNAAKLIPSVHSARTLALSCHGCKAHLSSKLDETCLAPTAWEDGFVASILIDLVRLVAGADWRPEALSLQSSLPGHEGCSGTLGGVPIRHGEDATAIEFPRDLLDRRLAPGRSRPAPTDEPASLPEDHVERIRIVLEFLIRQDNANVDSLAALVGTSRRSLQRQLLRRGQSFARMLELVRLDMARQMLENSSVKVIDVANDLGYSDPSHFARAFRRWTGVAPSVYRREAI
jgi:AraC-like DNA-binding protein